MYSIEYYDRFPPIVNYNKNSSGGIPISDVTTIYMLVYFGLTLNLIGSCLKLMILI